MKITVITSEKLAEFPPAITLLQSLDKLGHQINFLSPYKDPYFRLMSLGCAEHGYVLQSIPKWMEQYHNHRLMASAAFRLEKMLRKLCLRMLPKRFSEQIQMSDVVWVLNENTTFLGGKGFTKQLGGYLQTMYELHIKNQNSPKLYEFAAQRALLMVVPEYCRAHIVKAFYGLPHMPAIIPNKPLEHPRKKNLPITDPAIAAKIAELQQAGKKIVMYMGILSSERPLEPVIEAVNQTQDYVLVVLGGRTPYLDQLEKKMTGRFVYLGSVKPPHHLAVASHADVAYISYVANNQSINAVFCAPNKVYEFAGFGIPMLCNDNPGLKYTVEYYGMGICAEDMRADTIKRCLEQIGRDASSMSDAAHRYYDAEDVEAAVATALQRYMKIKEGK